MNREAEDLWWFERGDGTTVAFPFPKKIAVEFYYLEDCWLISVDGRTHRVSKMTVEDRRYWFPVFKGPWHNGSWARTGVPG